MELAGACVVGGVSGRGCEDAGGSAEGVGSVALFAAARAASGISSDGSESASILAIALLEET